MSVIKVKIVIFKETAVLKRVHILSVAALGNDKSSVSFRGSVHYTDRRLAAVALLALHFKAAHCSVL